jgi:hypothetical protein
MGKNSATLERPTYPQGKTLSILSQFLALAEPDKEM